MGKEKKKRTTSFYLMKLLQKRNSATHQSLTAGGMASLIKLGTLCSGYESEDSSGNEIDCDSSGKGYAESAAGKRSTDAVKAFNAGDTAQADFDDYLLKCKHILTQRQARSKKLLGEGRLKFMLNGDGEIEEDQETHAERHARIVALAERLCDASEEGKASESMKKPTKKKRKI
ncbi:hypothetical protein AAC387_Pa09g1347 [Persea americana]